MSIKAHRLAITPLGQLRLVGATEDDLAFGLASELSVELISAFAKSEVDGLVYLVSARCETSLPVSLRYWQSFAHRYFTSLRRMSSSLSKDWKSPDCPDDETLEELLRSAPPTLGLEYLNRDGLRRVWGQLDTHTRSASQKRKGGLAAHLHSLNSDWNLLGRVTFHLAENKKNPDRPFAFLATYTQTESGERKNATPKHVPLSEALKASIAAGDTRQLDALLTPVSKAAESTPAIAKMLQSKALFAPQAWTIAQAYEFFQSVPRLEESGVIVRIPDWWNASKPPRPQVTVRVGSRKESNLSGDALNLDVNVTIDGEPLTQEELAQLMAAREGMTLLRGKWVQVDADRLQSAMDQWEALREEHASGIGFLEGMRLLSGLSVEGGDVDEDTKAWSRIQPGDWLSDTLATLRDPAGKVDLDAGKRLHATLRPYQTEGVGWLWFASQLGLGVCLADDMGLGKTIQVIALLLQMKFGGKGAAESQSPPSLLILPTSLLGNWQREVEKFGPDLKLMVAHRSACDTSLLKAIAKDPTDALSGYDLVATTYGLARREKWIGEMNWNLVILDEAQAIKNAGAAQTKAIKKIPSRGRILLSGTPVENHLGDLWSLFDFCSPGLLGTAAQFKKFVNAKDERQRSARLSSVRKLIQPYVLRRMKTDPRIVPDLPAKTEMRVDCGLTKAQAALYQAVTSELEQALEIASGIQRRGMVLGALMQLKQICNHPALYLKQGDYDQAVSGKYNELRSICETILEKQEKVLIFSQFQSMCEPLANYLADVFGREGLILTGKTATKKRSKLVETFQDESGPPFMVISVKAGGTGLNLTQASHVVHFDRWWNPAVEDQATDRAFRIGQKRNVLVHKFVCRGTLEEKIDDMIRGKKELSRELFGGDEAGEINLTEMSNDQLLSFVSLDLEKAM
ncbi:DEAD/DEAH box helicase [Neorhodopirellula pilleata]|uniref:ATP-dependent helicase HepA n=1 Tax=Neorhodopirellula pilleata TaxID=2714738 RepID=A0A5C6A4W2_9BACT|nr:DEAD/DEAH box helicase [Neorhodopirellula pilleata]TWT94338.1 ATP-dependent helicase HepA [Neorhodopirellula pilleata]